MRIEIYRGTCLAEHESRELGVCWTLDRAAAERFATRSAIAQLLVTAFRRPDIGAALVPDGFDSPPAVLTTTVRRDDVTGLLTRLGEHEVFICPHRLRDVLSVAA